jgi:hypothetical protein
MTTYDPVEASTTRLPLGARGTAHLPREGAHVTLEAGSTVILRATRHGRTRTRTDSPGKIVVRGPEPNCLDPGDLRGGGGRESNPPAQDHYAHPL